MQIKDLQPRQGNVDITVEVTEKEPVREFEKFGRPGKVCNAMIKDASGSMKLTLWNEQTEQVNAGDTIEIKNGYVSEWQGEKQLSTGKFGSLNVVSKGASRGDEEETEEEKRSDELEGEEPITEDEVLEDDVVEDKELEKTD